MVLAVIASLVSDMSSHLYDGDTLECDGIDKVRNGDLILYFPDTDKLIRFRKIWNENYSALGWWFLEFQKILQ